MEYEMNPYTVFVKLDDNNLITAVNSSTFLDDTTGWTEIDRGYTMRHHHAQGNYFDKPIMDDRGIWRYKLEGSNAVERTQEEMVADYVEPEAQHNDAEHIKALEAQLAAYEAAYAEGVNEA